jgi:hypothetical protein
MASVNIEELAFRTNDGVDVSLLWCRTENRLTVLVEDQRYGASFELAAARDKALDVFYHPFAYAAAAGLLAERRDASDALRDGLPPAPYAQVS